MRILHLVSCRGWSSDAYWAARITRELERRGHEATLGCRAGTEERVISRARGLGVERIVTLGLRSGVAPGEDAADVRRLLRWLPRVDALHVHRGKEHWLAAVANRLAGTPRPLVRTRHIVQVVRPHAANRWLYRHGTALVHTVTEAIRRQYIASGLLPAERVVALPGGADAEAYRPLPPDPARRRALGGDAGGLLVGMIAGLRVMKGHRLVVEAVARLGGAGGAARVVFIGQGSMLEPVRAAIRAAGLEDRFVLAGFIDDLAPAMAALDVGLYVPLESEAMSRVVFEYLAAGRPLIASRVGVVPEILRDHEHALLVPAGDTDALAAALRELLADAALRARLGEAGRRLVLTHFSGARVAEALEAHYARLAAA